VEGQSLLLVEEEEISDEQEASVRWPRGRRY
jgi:hypothetical protein